MNIGDILISKDRSYTYRDYTNGNCVGKNFQIHRDLDTMLFLEDYFIPGNKYFVKKTTKDRVYVSSYKNVHMNGIFDFDVNSDFYWRNFFTTQSDIRDEKLKDLGI